MKDEKYILTSLDDENSKHIAEVLQNKTCKRIIDYLSEVKEASEQDIARALDIPINTTEYNLKKLIKAKLVEKTKNFFWSVKGRKIPMYKLAKKHIIISPKNFKPNLQILKTIIPILAIISIITLFFVFNLIPNWNKIIPNTTQINTSHINHFNSQKELNEFIKNNAEVYGGYSGNIKGGIMPLNPSVLGSTLLKSSNHMNDFSKTNVQVEGVDEADIVKNDGEYIYVVSLDKVVILKAYPAKEMKNLSEIKINNVNNIFINKDKLIIFASGKKGNDIYVYNIKDKENPKLIKKIETDTYYIDSRMIGDYVYIISNKYVNPNNPKPPIYYVEGIKEKVPANKIYYFNYYDSGYVFTDIMVLNLENMDYKSKVYLTGSSRNLFISKDNIYLTHQKSFDYRIYYKKLVEEVYFKILDKKSIKKIKNLFSNGDYREMKEIREVIENYSNSLKGEDKSEFDKKFFDSLREFYMKIQKENDKTIIYKIHINKEEINYIAQGEVSGRILNQFSMDEYEGYFRIATTTGHVGRRNSTSANHLYILDKDMNIVGKIENLAKGEKIYSARFLGKKAYIVTFKKVDPLFVIDLSNPKKPKVLGYLKITGFSDYLQPYDENHLIGIGKETKGGNEHFSWYQGIKVSIFDVSDFENPKEVAKYEIGDRGTTSEALYNHKAVLFDKNKNLLVIPIDLAIKSNDSYCYSGDSDACYGKKVWYGVYVFNISSNKIKLKGRITHSDIKSKSSVYDFGTKIRRSLYIDDVLYTISNNKVKANSLKDLKEIKNIIIDNHFPIYRLV